MTAPAIADAGLAGAWLVVIVDVARLARHQGVRPGRRALALALVGVVVGSALVLERTTGGRFVWHPMLASGGVLIAWGGVALHLWARRAIGAGWSPQIDPGPTAPLIETGPYALVRHPLYLAVLLVALGTVLAHPSRATLAGAIGMTAGVMLKRRAEERALARRFGERWRAYAGRVPALWPRLTRGRR